MTFSNGSTIIATIKLDILENDRESSYLEVFSDSNEIIRFSSYKSLIDCNKWNNFWIVFNNDRIKFGSGLIYGKNQLVSSEIRKFDSLQKILMKNNMMKTVNRFKFNDLGKKKRVNN